MIKKWLNNILKLIEKRNLQLKNKYKKKMKR